MTVPAVPAEGYFRHLPPRPRLYASASGRYCAIVVDFARHGVVIDLVERRVVADLDRGAYYPGTQHFPFAFLDLPDGEAYVHGTDWNRLDVSRARTGQLLTGREFPPGVDGRPERAIDYFHGGLSVSPDGRWIADDGWVWSPVGVPTVWSVDAWLTDPYESEEGLTLRRLAQRPDWNEPIVWSGGRLVLRGLGAWGDEGLLPGAEVFDPATGDEVLHFAGLEGRLLSFGDRLFSASVDGLDIWDATTGRRTGRIAGFQPVAVHPASGELLALEGATVVIGQPAAQRC